MATEKLAPVHPGEVLQQEFLIPLGLSQNRPATIWMWRPMNLASGLSGRFAAQTAFFCPTGLVR
jgi:plasmid maintenance system antidote protein VapI